MKMVLVILLFAMNVYSQNHIEKNGYRLDLDHIELINGSDTVKGYFAYHIKNSQIMLRIETNKKYQFASDVFTSIFKFEGWEEKTVTSSTAEGGNDIVFFWDNLFDLKFIRKLEYIKLLSIQDVIIYKYDGEMLFSKITRLRLGNANK